jgi:hypothetical protein
MQGLEIWSVKCGIFISDIRNLCFGVAFYHGYFHSSMGILPDGGMAGFTHAAVPSRWLSCYPISLAGREVLPAPPAAGLAALGEAPWRARSTCTTRQSSRAARPGPHSTARTPCTRLQAHGRPLCLRDGAAELFQTWTFGPVFGADGAHLESPTVKCSPLTACPEKRSHLLCRARRQSCSELSFSPSGARST